MKNSNYTIGNRTRNLPACSAMPQPTTPPRAPRNNLYPLNKKLVSSTVCKQMTDTPNYQNPIVQQAASHIKGLF